MTTLAGAQIIVCRQPSVHEQGCTPESRAEDGCYCPPVLSPEVAADQERQRHGAMTWEDLRDEEPWTEQDPPDREDFA